MIDFYNSDPGCFQFLDAWLKDAFSTQAHSNMSPAAPPHRPKACPTSNRPGSPRGPIADLDTALSAADMDAASVPTSRRPTVLTHLEEQFHADLDRLWP